jgi:hypothetical protein
MPQIPTLPIDEPVAQPKASPGEFASPGATVAQLGQETEQLALGNQAFEAHLYEAQRYLKYKQVEIQVGQLENQAHEALSKTTSPEDAQAVHAQFKQEVDNALGPYMADKQLARQLHIYGQQVDVQMQSTVNARKATIIQHSDQAANEVLYKSSVQEAVNIASAGGNPQVALDKLDAKLQSSVHTIGTMYPDQADKIMQSAHKDVDKGIIKAKSNSPDPKVREQLINQLRAGEGFPNLDDADINAALSAAEKRDRELTNLRTSEDYNGAVNHYDELTQGWTYEGKVQALNSSKWLKDNGFVDEHGQPDRKTADKLLEEADRQETRQRKIQSDKDNEIISKHSDAADTGKLSVPQIDKIVRDEGGSPKAASTLKSALHQHLSEQRAEYRFNEYVANAGDRKDRRTAKVEGEKTQANLFRQISDGATVDMSGVWDKVDAGEMTTAQALKVQSHIQARDSADYKYDSTKIQNATGFTDQQKTDMTLELLDAKTKQGLQGNEMHNFTDKMLKDAGQKQTTNYIEKWWGNLKEGRNISDDGPAKVEPAGKGIEQKSPSTGQYRYSTDGGKTWQPGQLPR